MMQDGAMRVGLDGINVEPVSDEHREEAKNNPRKVKIIIPKKNVQPKQDLKQNSEIKQDNNVVSIPKESSDIDDKPKRKVLSLKKKEG
jgi:CHASE2 domain-containing sensor protein